MLKLKRNKTISTFSQLRSVSKRLQELRIMREEYFSIWNNDPLGPKDGAKEKAFFQKYGPTMQAVEEKFRIPSYLQDARHIWSDHEMNDEEIAALKDFVASLKNTHPKLLEAYPGLANMLAKNEVSFRDSLADLNEPIRVAVTGASGNIGYALLYRIASGDAFGPRTPVILQLLELPTAIQQLKGVEMELRDCAFPNIKGIVLTDNPEVAFENVDFALLVGAQPRTKGMERGDLLQRNAEIFSIQGKALNKVGRGNDTRVIVVGNPANTNALIASANAPKIPKKNFAAMTKLDHTRGLAQLADKLNIHTTDIKKFCIWGNHSATQFPDISHATVNNNPLTEILSDDNWYKNTFIPDVQQRGAAIIKARGKSSAASAASALIDNVREWYCGTDDWTSVAVSSNGEYGIDKGLFFSYPILFRNQNWEIVKDLKLNEFAQERVAITHKELKEERDGVAKHLPRD